MAGAPILHVTNGDAVVPELAAAVGVAPDEVLVWREILHDGPVPAGLGPAELARVRARHLTARSWVHGTAPASRRPRSPPARARRPARRPPGRRRGGAVVRGGPVRRTAPARQVEDRLAGRPGPGLPRAPAAPAARRPARGARRPRAHRAGSGRRSPRCAHPIREPGSTSPASSACSRSCRTSAPGSAASSARSSRRSRPGRSPPGGCSPRWRARGPAVARRRPPCSPWPATSPAGRARRRRYELTAEGERRPGRRRHPPADRPLAGRRPPRPGPARLGLGPRRPPPCPAGLTPARARSPAPTSVSRCRRRRTCARPRPVGGGHLGDEKFVGRARESSRRLTCAARLAGDREPHL